jgi:hypothetical protein
MGGAIMPGEISLDYITGRTLRAVVVTTTGQYALGTAVEAWDAAHLAAYGIAIPELSVGSGQYAGDFPALPAGIYAVRVYEVAGADLAASDVPSIGGGRIEWDGAAEVVPAPTQPDEMGGYQFTTAALALAPSGAGPGTGGVVVTEDTGGANNLAAVDPAGAGIAGVTVRAYLATEWAADPTTAPVRGQQSTTSTGEWAGPMYLDVGTYTFVFSIAGYSTGEKTQVVA